MAHTFPIRGLIKLSVVFSLALSILMTIFLLRVGHSTINVLSRFIEIVLFALMVTLANIWLSTLSFSKTNNRFNRFLFYLFSYIWSILAWIIVIVLYAFMTGEVWEGRAHGKATDAVFLGVISIGIFNSLFLIVQNLVIVQYNNAKREIENLQLKNSLTDASNLLLRQQIQPHFLFNALTTVKSLYKQRPDQGEKYLVHLANFLRVTLSNRSTQTVVLKEELAFCNNYIQMQSIRFGDALKCDINITTNTMEQAYLPYFSLQPLIENVLKHNEFTENRPIKITIKESNGYIEIANNVQPRKQKEESTGNGLYNLAERYRLLGKEGIDIRNENDLFEVRLKLLYK